MANIVLSIEKGIEIGAEDALKWLTGANKALRTAPEVVAALATLIAAIEKPLADISGVAANPLNIALDIQTVNDLKAAWPAVRQFLTSMGVKFCILAPAWMTVDSRRNFRAPSFPLPGVPADRSSFAGGRSAERVGDHEPCLTKRSKCSRPSPLPGSA